MDNGTSISQDEIGLLDATQDFEGWRSVCEVIKLARNGEFPRDWWNSVIIAGVYERAVHRWGRNYALINQI